MISFPLYDVERNMPPAGLRIRAARESDLPELQAVRVAAFAPVFASFRSILGDAIYDVAQAPDDEAQAAILPACFEASSVWRLYAADISDRIVAFLSYRVDEDAGIGAIGLNAVHPEYGGLGIGSALYDFALDRMSEAGASVATVATGADPSHTPARRAYAKAGFNVEIPSVWLCCDLRERTATSDGVPSPLGVPSH